MTPEQYDIKRRKKFGLNQIDNLTGRFIKQ